MGGAQPSLDVHVTVKPVTIATVAARGERDGSRGRAEGHARDVGRGKIRGDELTSIAVEAGLSATAFGCHDGAGVRLADRSAKPPP